ncbi:MAG: hypothetical protein KJ630_24925 [Proteobacteria bacterium]|nr:hypothetical protein [Pseudomonadota bacterium]
MKVFKAMLSEVVNDVFDYVTKGKVPTDSIPPGIDASSVDPSKEECARMDIEVSKANDSDAAQDLKALSLNSGFTTQASQEDLRNIALNEADSLQVRKDAVAQITDQEMIAKIACEAKNSGIRLVAVQKLNVQPLLGSIAVAERHWKVRLAAVEKLDALEVLDTVVAKDRVEAVRKAASTRHVLLKKQLESSEVPSSLPQS